ncbi:MAG: isocitrate/isopropylmalate dehydrogenase family protein [Armatimonadota bacterium]
MCTHKIAVIPGDGIGGEVVAAGVLVLRAAAERFGFRLDCTEFPWGCGYYLQHGHVMPPDGLETLSGFDAIYLGAVGLPGQVPEEIGVRGLVLAIRTGFDQFANVRPVKPLPGAPFCLNHVRPEDIDFVVVREATECLYVGLGGRYKPGEPEFEAVKTMRPAFAQSREIAYQTGLYSEQGCRRVIEYAFELARRRNGKKLVSSATKTNAMSFGMKLWDEIFDETALQYPDIRAEWQNVDAMAMRFVTQPERFDVVVAGNLFGDILTDLSAALVGGLGFAPGGNIAPTGLSMFEPPHGSAPDITGKGIANPIATILTGAMLLCNLGEGAAAQCVEQAVAAVVAEGKTLTPDAGGTASTGDVANAIVDALSRGASL